MSYQLCGVSRIGPLSSELPLIAQDSASVLAWVSILLNQDKEKRFVMIMPPSAAAML